MATTLLFLHGVGNGDPTDTWRQTLDTSPQRIRSQLELLEPVSDPSVASLKDLRHKREVLARAIECLTPERDVLELGSA